MSMQEVVVKEKKKQPVCDRCNLPRTKPAKRYQFVRLDDKGELSETLWDGDLCKECVISPVLNSFTKRTRTSRTTEEGGSDGQ